MDYGEYYGFSRMPFGESADREVFFKSETHKEALALTLYGIRERKGYIVIFGEQGMGKTTLIRQMMDQLDERTRVALISQSHDQYFTLLKELMEKLGLRAKGVTKGSMLHELYEYLTECLKKSENIVICLDDAHRMKDEIIEELRLLSNLETSRTKLIQIVIVGEPELDRRLNSKHMRQIRQRIQILHRLLPLGHDESLKYIEHRLTWAGGSSGNVFTPEALASICKYAGGIPQNINALCDRALTLGSERSEKPVSAQTVGDARKTAALLIQASSSSPSIAGAAKSALRSPWLYAALAVAVAGVFLGSYYLSPTSRIAPGSAVVQPAPSHKASVSDDAVGTQSTKGAKAPGPPAEKPETQPAPPAARVPVSVAQEPTDANVPVKEVTVTEGATLSSIATRHYGFVNATVLDCILEANPEIADVDFIRAGSQVLLPQAVGKARFVKRPDGSLGIHAATFMTYREARDYAGKIGSDLGSVDIVKRRVAPQKDWYRILVGPFGSREEARSALQSLERRVPQ
jgi:general secretion pathway protein A